jgi:hypothetical protein
MKELYIGRLKGENDVVLENEKVSRIHHCKCVLRDDGIITITDLGSLNGVFVDGKKITEETIVKKETLVKIGNVEIIGADVRKWFEEKEPDVVARSKAMKIKYERLSERYHNNLVELKKRAEIKKTPFVPVFPSDSTKIEYYINEYHEKYADVFEMVELLSKSSKKDARQFVDDMDEMQRLCKTALETAKEVCDDIRYEIRELFASLEKYVETAVNNVLWDINSKYSKFFNEYYETCDENRSRWDAVKENHIVSMPDLYYRIIATSLPIFEKTVFSEKLDFIQFLDKKNLVIRYNSQSADTSFNIVNSIIVRVLYSSRPGNVEIHMMDCKDLGGTSNILKLLNRRVFKMYSSDGEIRNELSGLSIHIENVVQNLLQGAYTSLAEYNNGKENQQPYHVVVIKDFPFGLSTETAYLLQKILSNGIRAGVHVVFLLNEDLVQKDEDAQKIVNITGIERTMKTYCFEVPLTQPQPAHTTCHYSLFSDGQMDAVIKYVNAGFEVKKETVLRLLDYMIPEKDWWTGKSANRIDVPFGISSDMQTQAIHFTQESGQNSAVVIGIPGTGKSVFLHALIANAVVHYSPKELQLYLLDFSGVEFNTYAQHRLPHARVIAAEAEREFGHSILNEINEEGSRRMALCKENDVTNIVELKEKFPDMVMPRLLVVIDEFQKLFEIENDKISQDANRCIHIIIQEYRKFGINLVLATQKLPSKSILPRELIANRIVFNSDPNDFGDLIKWPSGMVKPKLGTGVCIYNDARGSEYANSVTRGYFIKASTELNTLLDRITELANEHQEQLDENHDLRVFSGAELPEIANVRMDRKHYQLSDIPKEVGVYVGESIAISPTDVYVPLVKESNNNIIIIGGRQDIAKKIAYHTILSQSIAHNEETATFAICNFMRDDDELQALYQSDRIEAVKHWSANWLEAKKPDEVANLLSDLKKVVDYRKNLTDESEMEHIYLHITAFQLGRMFDMVGASCDRPSECGKLLESILKDGPSLGVFTVLQVDNLNSLNRLGRGALNYFNHRIALQMTEIDSNKVVGTSAANKLRVSGHQSPDSSKDYRARALYFNYINNEITKFKPYK